MSSYLISPGLIVDLLSDMVANSGRSLRDWKLPFTGHHLIYWDPTEEAICYTLAPFLACVILHHLVNVVGRCMRRRKIRKGAYQSIAASRHDTRDNRRKRGWKRAYPTAMTAIRNHMELRPLPASWISVSNYVELAWTLIYCAIVLVPTFYLSYTPYYNGRPHGNKNPWANPTGAAAFAQLPIIIALAGKNNLVSVLTGLPYQELNYLHRASGRLCLLCSWIHTIGWMDGAYGVGMTGRFGYDQDWIIWGFVGLAALTILTLSSFRLFRQMAYEAFLFTHIITTILFLIGCYFHWDWQAYWVWSGWLLWIVDRGISLARLVIVNKLWLIKSAARDECGEATIEVLDGEVMRLTMKRDLLDWKAGQHAFLSMPSIGWTKVEQHPFSFANCPVDGFPHEAIFLIKAEQGFTRQLYDQVISQKTTEIPTYLDGPYGTMVDLTPYSTVLGIAGGTGITHVLSHAMHLLELATTTGQIPLRHLHIVWNIRHASHVEWVAPLLNSHFANLSSTSSKHLRVTIDVHVTRENVSREPHEEPVELSHAIESVLHAMPGHVHRESASPAERLSIDDEDRPQGHERRPLLVSAASMFTEAQEVLDTKRGDRHGLSSEVWRLIRWQSGRAELRGYAQEDIDESHGEMGVIVCGPKELLDSAAQAVREVGSARAVWNGQPPIHYYRDTFGW